MLYWTMVLAIAILVGMVLGTGVVCCYPWRTRLDLWPSLNFEMTWFPGCDLKYIRGADRRLQVRLAGWKLPRLKRLWTSKSKPSLKVRKSFLTFLRSVDPGLYRQVIMIMLQAWRNLPPALARFQMELSLFPLGPETVLAGMVLQELTRERNILVRYNFYPETTLKVFGRFLLPVLAIPALRILYRLPWRKIAVNFKAYRVQNKARRILGLDSVAVTELDVRRTSPKF